MKVSYLVAHAGVVNMTKLIEYEGGSATVAFDKLRVELCATDGLSSSIIVALPPETTGYVEGATVEIDFPEGAN